MSIERTGWAVWKGDLRAGAGHVNSASGALDNEPYSFGTRFENEPGTNPEELIAAAHAACYSMALAGTLSRQGHHPEQVQTRATCTVEPKEGGGFKITHMRLEVRGRIPGMDDAAFKHLAEQGDRECPVSNLLRPGLTIELDAALME